jgi:hypothetical protein
MERNISNSQTARNAQEDKGAFAFYIEIDLGDKHSDFCVLDSAGEVKRTLSFENEGAGFASIFHEHSP